MFAGKRAELDQKLDTRESDEELFLQELIEEFGTESFTKVQVKDALGILTNTGFRKHKTSRLLKVLIEDGSVVENGSELRVREDLIARQLSS